MTARVNMIFVILEEDIRTDDVQPLMDAIKMMKGVLDVEQHITNPQDILAESRARHELGVKLLEVIYPTIREKEI